MRGLLAIIVISCLLSNAALANKTICPDHAQTQLEVLYCQIKASKYHSSLPPISQFRDNHPLAQRQVILEPAQKLGLEVPTVAQIMAEHRKKKRARESALPLGVNYSRDQTGETHQGEDRASLQQHSGPLRAGVGAADTQAAKARQKTDTHLDYQHNLAKKKRPPNSLARNHCYLLGVKIRCSDKKFHLVQNKSKGALSGQALADNNKLILPPFHGLISDEAAVKAYLIQAYAIYINRMISLGLGGSTMSFTSFYYNFVDQKQRNVDFVKRFELMFDLLKRDRKHLPVSVSNSKNFPTSIKQCDRLNQKIIICNDETKNWVYQAN